MTSVGDATPRMAITILDPMLCHPPHKVTHPDKRDDLLEEFSKNGWDYSRPPLIGYVQADRSIQLLSGSHRWCAALFAGILIPVFVYPEEEVRGIWGDLEAWSQMMEGTHG